MQYRPRPVASVPLLDERRACRGQTFDLRVPVVGDKVEVNRIRVGPGLLAPLEQEARPRSIAIDRLVRVELPVDVDVRRAEHLPAPQPE